MKRAWAALVACACGAQPAATPVFVPPVVADRPRLEPPKPPRRPSLEPLARPTCIVKGGGVLRPPVPLAIGRKVFAVFRDVRSSELRATKDAATITIEAAGAILTGDARLDLLSVRPREYDLHDKWLGVRRAAPKRVEGDRIEASLNLPRIVETKASIGLTLWCDDLWLDDKRIPFKNGRVLTLADRRIALLDGPNGAEIASILPTAKAGPARSAGLWLGTDREAQANVDPTKMREAIEIERRAGFVRVRLPATDVDAFGWIEASAITAARPGGEMHIESFTVSSGRSLPKPLVCPDDVTIRVKDGDKTLDVGVFRAGSEIPRTFAEEKDGMLVVEPGESWDEIVDAFGGETELVRPFVDGDAVAHCKR